MKTNKKLAFISLGAVAMAIIGAYSYSNGANAQAAQEPAAPKASSIPRHVGSFSAGLINAITYTPSCPGYVFPMDAAAIQESRSRAFVEAEVIRFRNIREGMDNYEDCMIENARRDIDVISGKLSAYLTAEAGKEAANYSALGEAARANADRIRSGGGGAAKKKKGARLLRRVYLCQLIRNQLAVKSARLRRELPMLLIIATRVALFLVKLVPIISQM
ncbi:MAG: hypothetical protein FD128_1815 [Hyphomonadaceae bacterium]|nr:MAG: hypothetical protein FD128_1815 [Hyphomonadaceae bacterium]